MRFKFFNKEFEIRSDWYFFKSKNNGLIFIHPPKNGGTSITNALRFKFRSNFILSNKATIQISNSNLNKKQELNYNQIRMILLNYAVNKQYRFISGHFSFYDGIFNDCKNYFLITILRDPVKTFISKYFFTKEKLSLDDFLKTQKAIDWGMDLIIRFSCPYKKYKNLEEQINETQNNLRQFDYVGDLDNIDEFNKWFFSKYRKNIKVGMVNTNNKKNIITNENLSKIKEICRPSILAYKSIQNFK